MYAVIETGGKQYKVQEGDTIFVEKNQSRRRGKIDFSKVLLVQGDELVIGKPYLENAKVEGTVIEQGKAKKIIVYKYKSKKIIRKARASSALYKG